MSTQLLNAPLRNGQMVPNQYEVKGQVGFSQIVQQWPLRIEFPCSEKITIDKVKSFSLQILFPVLGQTLERFYFLLQKRKMFVATFRIRRIILQQDTFLPLLCTFSYYLLPYLSSQVYNFEYSDKSQEQVQLYYLLRPQ